MSSMSEYRCPMCWEVLLIKHNYNIEQALKEWNSKKQKKESHCED